MENVERLRSIERVRKLLALSGSPNEHEAISAAEKAHVIMLEQNISLDDVKSAEQAITGFVSQTVRRSAEREWLMGLAATTARMMFCQCWFTVDPDAMENALLCSFVGEPQNVAAATSMFVYFDRTMLRLAQLGAPAQDGMARHRYIVDFQVSCSVRLCKRIMQRIEDAKRGGVLTGDDGRKLPALANLYDRKLQAVHDHLKQQMPGLQSNTQKMSAGTSVGARDGAQAGNSISLDTQVDDVKAKRLC